MNGLFFDAPEIDAIRERAKSRPWAQRALERIRRRLEGRRLDLLEGGPDAEADPTPGATFLDLALCGRLLEDGWHREAALRLLDRLDDPAPFRFKQSLELCMGLDFLSDLDDARRARLVERILLPVADRFMEARIGGGNIQTTYDLNLLCIGLLTGRTDYVARAVSDPERGIPYQLANSVYPDGFWFEQSHASYHSGSIERLLKIRRLAIRHGLPVEGDAVLCRMLDTLPGMALPGGVLPLIGEIGGDARPTLQRDWLELAYAMYGTPWIGWALGRSARDGLWALLVGREIGPAEEPDSRSRLFEATGLAVLKHGRPGAYWEGKGSGATITFGPHGDWHGHAGKLGIEYRHDDRYLVRDHGHSGGYAHPIHRMWYMTTLAHSTVVADERNQTFAWCKGRPEKERLQTGRSHATLFRDDVSACTVSADFAYPGCAVKRTLFLTGRYLLDITECDARDGAAHTFDWVLHTGGTLVPDRRYGNGVLACVNKGPPILTAPGQDYAPGSGWAASYDFIREVQALETGERWTIDVMDCKWASDVWKIGARAMRLVMEGEAGTTVFKGVCPAVPAEVYNPVVLVRRRAVRTVFIALHVPGEADLRPECIDNRDGSIVCRVGADLLVKREGEEPAEVAGCRVEGKLAFVPGPTAPSDA